MAASVARAGAADESEPAAAEPNAGRRSCCRRSSASRQWSSGPLFSPTRRMPVLTAAEPETAPAEAPPGTGGGRTGRAGAALLRNGTAGRQAAALVTFPRPARSARLGPATGRRVAGARGRAQPPGARPGRRAAQLRDLRRRACAAAAPRRAAAAAALQDGWRPPGVGRMADAGRRRCRSRNETTGPRRRPAAGVGQTMGDKTMPSASGRAAPRRRPGSR